VKTPFQTIASAGIPVLVVGANALHAYGYTRQSVDFDFMLAEEDYPRLRDYLEGEGYSEEGRVGRFWRFRQKEGSGYQVDIGMLDRRTFDRLLGASIVHTWGGAQLQVPRFEHLIALKLHAAKNVHRRHRDIADVIELLRLNPGLCTDSELKSICDRYGPAEVYESLKDLPPYEQL